MNLVLSYGLGVDASDDFERVYLMRKGEEQLPARENYIVVGPAGARDKALPSFPRWWEEAEHEQLSLSTEELVPLT